MPHVAIPTVHLERAGSTNDEALALWRHGEQGPLWVVAERQTAGRGRAGRDWQSGIGNLNASLLFTVTAPAASLPQLSLVAGLAVHEAIVELAGARRVAGLRLKWPNDILIGDAKVGGILVESHTGSAFGTAAVVGIGLNVVSCPADLARPVTCLAAQGLDASRDEILAHLGTALSAWIGRWDNGHGFSIVRSAWLEKAGAIDEAISVNTGEARVVGRYRGIDDAGALLVADAAGRISRITYGDVELE